MTDWNSLLTRRRLGRPHDLAGDEPGRAPFEVDLDRILFCEAFRALQDKLQVHGVPGTPHPRNRLTHSLEVSRVARTLGMRVGERLQDDPRAHEAGTPPAPESLAQLCAAAAAAHDLGTPPFAHVGERAISDHFSRSASGREVTALLPEDMQHELTCFEGNAQGFRELARLQGWRREGGLNLTCATLAAHAKYPHGAGAERAVKVKDRKDAAGGTREVTRKYGHFGDDADLFREVADTAGLPRAAPGAWGRHPAAHLVEAADDACYSVIDLEDSARLGVIGTREAEALLTDLIGDRVPESDGIGNPADRLVLLRSRAVSALLDGVVEVFTNDLDAVMEGRHGGGMLHLGPHAEQLKRIADVSRERIYRNPQRSRDDVRAETALGRILDEACSTLLRSGGAQPTGRDARVADLVHGDANAPTDPAPWMRRALDHVSALTDREALALADTLAGSGCRATA